MARSTEEAREAIRAILTRTGMSMRALSAAMGRDPGYIAAYLDSTRPSRARPTPDDLVAAADATEISVVELLEAVWGIDRHRLAGELAVLGVGGPADRAFDRLTDAERREVADFAAFIVARRRGRKGHGGGSGRGGGGARRDGPAIATATPSVATATAGRPPRVGARAHPRG